MIRRLDNEPDDRGFTLLEVLVGMSILSIFLAIFGGSMISMFNSVNRTQQTANAQSQVNQLFVKLDREIRYASGISQPAIQSGTGDVVVEFVSSYSGTPICTQLRLTPSGDLQQRTWQQDLVPVVPSRPAVLATTLHADTPTHPADANTLVAGPFALLSAVGSSNNQRLEVALSATDSTATSRKTRVRHTDVTFTALNTGTSTSSNTVCAQGRSIAWPST